MESFLDIHQVCLHKHKEELCGDQVRVIKSPDATTLVLSDGLGSGVKANILATLTAEIIATMLREDADLRDVLDTVIRTLPVDPALHIAYATFTILTIAHADTSFRLVNFDNPPPFLVKGGRLASLETNRETILGKEIATSQGSLEMGDFIGLVSDGVLFAGPGATINQAWDRDAIGRAIERVFNGQVFSAHSVVNSVMAVTNQLYEWKPGDDASMVGVYRRQRHRLMVFTGPPVDNGFDYVPVFRLLDFPGRKIVCGGTTANIVASYLIAAVETDSHSMAEGIPAIGRLPGIDLVTEGIFTLAAALERLETSGGNIEAVEAEYNGAAMLARELLGADAIEFLVGQSVNPAYQNPLLPKNVSIRRYLIEHIAALLTRYHKDVAISYY
ncbi:MAG TPA: SpoIIE family protein phosphatase [Anaerolineaceae bacterium]